ncbi:Putative phosphatidate phosphatase [Eumeta japonica]|uniref:Phosphatidate phosphatase n=1 Tax=Eumeta variegata TaxID=151549 RepID=A0A4C1UMY0_EUMVA|nr:Putative phosphatidate phosphatase [Eumeta japonica]
MLKVFKWNSSLNYNHTLVSATVGFVLLAFGWWVTPHRRGYFPDDHSLMLPFKRQSISEVTLACVGFALNIITIIAVEAIRSRRGDSGVPVRVWGRKIPGWVFVAYRVIGIFTFGAAAQQITTTLAKYAVGRLRPHFFDWQIKEWKREELTFLCDVFTLDGHRSFEHDCGLTIITTYDERFAVAFAFDEQKKASAGRKQIGWRVLRRVIATAFDLENTA